MVNIPNIKFTILTIFKGTVQWGQVHSQRCATVAATRVRACRASPTETPHSRNSKRTPQTLRTSIPHVCTQKAQNRKVSLFPSFRPRFTIFMFPVYLFRGVRLIKRYIGVYILSFTYKGTHCLRPLAFLFNSMAEMKGF